MFLKPITFSFLLLFCILSCNLASPSRYRRDASEASSPLLTKDIAESVQQLTNEIEKSIKHLAQSSEWIYNNLVSIVRSGLDKGFQNIASWALDFVVRMELLVVADGSHFVFPLTGKSETEQEYKTVAIAVSKLLMNLKTMERSDQVLKSVTNNLLSNDVAEPHLKELKNSPEKMLRTFLHMYFEALDRQMEADGELRDEYKRRKTEAKELVKRDPKMNDPVIKIWEKSQGKYKQVNEEEMKSFLQDKKILRQAISNKLFLKQSVKHFSMIFSRSHHKQYLLARAMIQKAASSNIESKINEVYHQALVKAAEISVDEDDEDISKTLFDAIEKGLESEPTLSAEVRGFMKQIEGTTTYDTDMLYIDFSIL